MSRFDRVAGWLAHTWGFTESPHEYRERVWHGEQQGEQIRTSGGERQYLRTEHDDIYLTLNVPNTATAEQIIALFDLVSEMLSRRDDPPAEMTS